MKISKGQLKFLIEKILREGQRDKNSASMSIDSQIDQFLMEYEKIAKLNENFHDIQRYFLAEADDGTEDENSKENLQDLPQGKLTVDDLNVEEFANNLVRLIDNFSSLIEIRDVVLRRAYRFLDQNYDNDVKDALAECLEEEHGIELDATNHDREEDLNAEVPNAKNAGPDIEFNSNSGGAGFGGTGGTTA